MSRPVPTFYAGSVTANWDVNWDVLREVRYRHRIYCHKEGETIVDDLIWDFPVRRVGATSSDESFDGVSRPVGSACSVVRHRLNVVYVGKSGQEYRFSPGNLTPQLMDFGLFE